MIEFGHATHIGLRRARNEDTYYADPSLGLFLVADGMGGHQHGEVAAALVRDTVVERIGHGQSLTESIREAGARLMAHPRQPSDALPMGTTIAALQLVADGYEIAWVGDSRVYQWRSSAWEMPHLVVPGSKPAAESRALRQMSHDHSLAQERADAAPADPDQAARPSIRNVITQALGVTAVSALHIGMARGRLQPGSAFLLCTDGLTESLADDAIAALMARTDLAAQECVDHLLLAALDHGAEDNVTVILARIS